MPTLVYWDSDGIERLFDIGSEPVMIGRAAECQIRSDDTRVSRRHARIVSNGRDCWIEDLGSANGVYVGAERVSQTMIPPGEIMVVGSILLQLQSSDGQMLAPSVGTHAQLSVWLKMEREKRAALTQERNALGERLAQLHRDGARPGGGPAGPGGIDPAQVEEKLAQLRAELETQHAREIERILADADMTREEAVARTRAEVEAELDDGRNRQRTELDVSGQLQAQVQQLWGNLRDAKQKIAQLEDEARQSQERADAAEDAHARAAAEVERLSQEAERLRGSESKGGQQLSQLQAANAELLAQRTDLEVQLAEMQEAADQAATDHARRLQESQAAHRELEHALDEARSSLSALREDAGRQIAEAEQEAATLAAQCDQFAERLDTITRERDDMARELDAIRGTMDSASQESAIELAATTDRVRELEAMLGPLAAERDELRRELTELRDERGTTDEVASRLAAVHKDRLALVKQRDELEQALDEVQRERDKLASELGALRNARMNDEQASASRVAEAEAARARLAAELAEAQAGLANLHGIEGELAAERQRAAVQRDELAAVEQALAEAQASRLAALAEAQEEIQRLTGEIAEREREVEGFHQSQNELAEELERVREAGGDSARLRAELEQVRGELDQARGELDQVRGELDQVRGELDQVRGELDQTGGAAAAADRERELRREAEDQLTELQDRIETLERELARAEAAPAPDAQTGLPSEATEHILTLYDCVAALRTSMRAACDEAAVIPGDSESVQVVVDALSDATQQIETARDSLRTLQDLFGME